MIPRGDLYISWADLVAAALYCVKPQDTHAAQQAVETLWAPNTVACLSVRSGLDAFLQAVALPAGSEVIIASVTIPHILEILSEHELTAVAVDIDPETLAVSASAVRSAVTPRTKAIMVAHLFGSRMLLDEIAEVAQQNHLLLIEDCAQAYDGNTFVGHPSSTVSMFSFGPIKRQTALGGGLLRFRVAGLAASVRAIQSRYPRQTRQAYVQRVLRVVLVKAVTNRMLFALFVALCRILEMNHDEVIGGALRGFKNGNLFDRIRQQPAAPLLKMLERRLRQHSPKPIEQRMAIVRQVVTEFPALRRLGSAAPHHTHWLFPLRTEDPDGLMRHLWSEGFDATRGASNLVHVPGAADQFMNGVLYLPLYPSARESEMHRMARAIRNFENGTVEDRLLRQSYDRACRRRS